MVFKRGRMALYEAVSKARLKSTPVKTVEPIRPEKPGEKPAIADTFLSKTTSEMVKWFKKPNFVQVNAGRVEISLPWQAAVAVVLVLILLLSVVFRLGQHSGFATAGQPANEVTHSPAPVAPSAVYNRTPAVVRPEIAEPAPRPMPTAARETPVVTSKGANRIVIASSARQADLETAKSFFAAEGIATEVRNFGSVYSLVTSGKYENPAAHRYGWI